MEFGVSIICFRFNIYKINGYFLLEYYYCFLFLLLLLKEIVIGIFN